MSSTKRGLVELVSGCMFSGKTKELIRRVNQAKNIGLSVAVFNPMIDNRFSKNKVVSHNGSSTTAHSVSHSSEIMEYMDEELDVIVIDEAQFFDEQIIHVVNELAIQGNRVIVAGLDRDFRGEPFGPMPMLIDRSDLEKKLTAICPVCQNKATRTQRLINGKPADYNDPIVMIGASEAYEPRCEEHHEVPNKPLNNTSKLVK